MYISELSETNYYAPPAFLIASFFSLCDCMFVCLCVFVCLLPFCCSLTYRFSTIILLVL